MAAAREALCVGINYTGTSAELRGCVNDAKDWAQYARMKGYRVTLLTNGAATREAILGELAAMAGRVKFGGRVLFSISSHGTSAPDMNGDEVDGWDEAIVPSDYQTNGLIIDDEFAGVLSKRHAGTRWVTVVDACHSGTFSRAFGEMSGVIQGFRGRLEGGEPRPRYLPPSEALNAETVARLGAISADEPVVPRPRAATPGVVWAGCRDDQVSYDAFIGGRYRGAFTAAAMNALANLPASPTNGALKSAISPAMLPSRTFPQNPQLTATVTQRRWTVLG